MTMGEKIQDLRKRSGMSQDALAEQLGVSRQAVSKWERNEAYPDTENLIAISRFYNISIDDLINKSLSLNAMISVENDTENESRERKLDISEINDDDDDDDNDDDDDDEGPAGNNSFRLWYSIPYPIVITVAYLLWGFLAPRGWEIGWTLFLTIPVYYSAIECMRQKRLSSFAYPVLVTFIYLLFGMIYQNWHPLWVIYLTIPIYYPIASAIDKTIRKK